jgi:hypothetical protein
MIESWLLADRETIARALAVRPTFLTDRPDELTNPKRELVNLARRSSRRSVRTALVPETASGALVGYEYLAFLESFVNRQWRPDAAAEASPSLARALARLRELT